MHPEDKEGWFCHVAAHSEGISDSVEANQTAPIGAEADWSGSALFAHAQARMQTFEKRGANLRIFTRGWES